MKAKLLSVMTIIVFGLGCSLALAVKEPLSAKKPTEARGKTFNDLLLMKANSGRTFLGYRYPGIKWMKHVPLNTADYPEGEVGSGGQGDVGVIDLDGDKQSETIQAIWGPGVSDHSLNIEIYKGKKKIDEIEPLVGIQPNFTVKDIDHDGKMEIVIWGGLWDPRTAGEDDVTEANYEGHSDPHRYVVATYKLIRGEYYLWDVYTTKKKCSPFSENQPLRD